MKLLFAYFGVIFVTFTCTAQNHVLNGSFESYNTCPTNFNQSTYCNGWRSYTAATPDYFNICSSTFGIPDNFAGHLYPVRGNAYTGIHSYGHGGNYKEYLTSHIIPLQVGYRYAVSYYAALGDTSDYGVDDLGAYFYSKAPSFIYTINNLNVTPQVSYSGYGPVTIRNGWQRLTGLYVADSTYTDIVIGGFKNSSQVITSPALDTGFAAYYLIDSVVVIYIGNIFLNFSDSNFCVGDSIKVPFYLDSFYVFNNNNQFRLQLSDANGSFASPTVIGTLTSKVAGTINGVLPSILPQGDNYRVRVVSSSPIDSSEYCFVPMHIYNKPNYNLSFPNSVCYNDSVTGIVTGPNISSVLWNGPHFTNDTNRKVTIPHVVFADTGKYSINVYNNSCVVRDSLALKVKPLADKPIIVTNAPICEDDTLVMIGATTTAGVSWQWSGPNFTASTPIVKIAGVTHDANEGNYILSAILNNCASTDTEYVVVKPRPRPNPMVQEPTCIGKPLFLSTTDTFSVATYSWSGPSGFTSSFKKTIIAEAADSNSGRYIVSVTSAGCTGIDTLDVIVSPFPKKPIATTASPVCAGTLLNLFASDTISTATYSWQAPGGLHVNGGNTKVVVSLQNNGQFILRADINGCSSYDTADVVVKVVPDTPLVSSNSPIQEGQSLYLYLKNPQSRVTYEWGGPDNFSSTFTNPIIEVAGKKNAGTYFIKAKLNDCYSSTILFVTIDGKADTGYVVLYPNANNGNFTLKALVSSDQNIPVAIFATNGQLIFREILKTQNKMLEYNFLLKDRLASGMYTCKIIINKQRYTLPFIVDR
ncbi:MAG: T9SS type A sorting domain-containing protein [Bacteroidetes bacterium]|nr:T9SS type A sorting domain-containing protein [Bacteroidota bacterium]